MKAYVYGEKRDLPAGFRDVRRPRAYRDRLDRHARGPSRRHAGLSLPGAARPGDRRADRPLPRRGAGARRADHPRQDRAPEGRRRRREGHQVGLAADLPALCRRHPQCRRARDRGLALDGAGDARRAGRPRRRHQEAAVGVLSDRSRFSPPQHGCPHGRPRRRLHRLLRAQRRLRRLEPQLPRRRAPRPRPRHQCGDGGRGAEDGVAPPRPGHGRGRPPRRVAAAAAPVADAAE